MDVNFVVGSSSMMNAGTSQYEMPDFLCGLDSILNLNLSSSSTSSDENPSSIPTQNLGSVFSVFGRVGNVIAALGDYTTSLVPESGSNLYFTVSRARQALEGSLPIQYNSTTGVISIQKATTSNDGYLSSTDWNTFNGKQNALGYTPESVNNKVTSLASPNDTTYPTTQAVASAISSLVTGVSSVFGRTGNVNAQLGDYNTSLVPENTNLYFTTARARLSISANNPLQYNETTGVLTINQATTSTSGFLSNTDWNTFNNKQNALFFGNLTSSGVLSVTGGTNRLVGGNASISFSGAANVLVRGDGSTTPLGNLYSVSGNTLSANAVLGLTDGFTLSIITNNITRISIAGTGEVAMGSAFQANTRLHLVGIGTTSSTNVLYLGNSSTRIITVRDDGEAIFGPLNFGPSIRVSDVSGNLSLTSSVLNFRNRNSPTSGSSFIFNTVAQTGLDGDTTLVSFQPSFTNNVNNRVYNILSILGSVTNNNNVVNGLLIEPSITNADFIAINTRVGRHIFNGAQNWARRTVSNTNATLGSSDFSLFIECTVANLTVTLPTLSGAIENTSRIYVIKRTDTTSHTLTITGNIDFLSNYTLFGGMSVWLAWDNAALTWRTF